jgi:hypothetical protein
MQHVYRLAAIAALLLVVGKVSAQSSTFTFEDSTDDGFGLKFSNDASANFTVANIGGSNRMLVPRTGAFQEADHGDGNTSGDFFKAMQAAMTNPSGYALSYDWYVDTSTFGTAAGQGTFLQLGSYVNGGDGAYAQDFGTVKEAELSGTQLASGQVFQGHVSVNMATAGLVISSAETFYRVGLIENGDGTSQAVYYDNIAISPVPEPATLSLLGLGLSALAIRRRRV